MKHRFVEKGKASERHGGGEMGTRGGENGFSLNHTPNSDRSGRGEQRCDRNQQRRVAKEGHHNFFRSTKAAGRMKYNWGIFENAKMEVVSWKTNQPEKQTGALREAVLGTEI